MNMSELIDTLQIFMNDVGDKRMVPIEPGTGYEYSQNICFESPFSQGQWVALVDIIDDNS